MKIRLVGAEIVTCGRTDMTKLIVAFLNLANAPKNHSHSMSGRKSREETS